MADDFTALSHALPPQNVEAEESILGGILLDPEAMGRVVDTLVPEAFYNSIHRRIYTAAAALHKDGQRIDLMTTYSWLQDQGELDAIGGQGTLAQLVDRTVSAVNIDRYAELLMDKYTRRRLISASYDIAGLGYNTTIALDEVCDKSEQAMFAVTQRLGGSGLHDIGDIGQSFFEQLEAAMAGDAPTTPTGFYDLDKLLVGGVKPGDLILLAARPSMGKSAIAFNAALNIAKEGKPVAIFSLEMGKEQIYQRLVSGVTSIIGNKIQSGQLDQDEVDRIVQAMGWISSLPLRINDNSATTVAQIRSDARQFAAVSGGSLGVIIIDYLQLIEGGGDNRNLELGRMTRQLKALAREINTPIILLSQLSRDVEKRTNKRPMMSDLRDSGAIEQDADQILMLYRDHYYNPESPASDAELIVAKNRTGATGKVNLLFRPELTRFDNLAKYGAA